MLSAVCCRREDDILEFAHFVELAFLPCLGLAVAIGIAWRRVADARLRKAMQIAGALLFFVPQPFVLYLGAYSVQLRLYQQVLLALWGFGIAALLLIRMRTAKVKPIPRTLAALVMAGLGVYCGWNVVGDYLLEREPLVGRIDGMRVVHHRRSPDSYQVLIARQPHDIPLDLAVTLRPGDQVEAQVGVASGTILAVHRTP
jgi:hypothetical protein